MLFKKFRSVPANTKVSAPDWQKLQIGKGTIIEWIIVTPLECANLMQFWVDYHKLQILPFSTGERIYGMSWPTVIRDNILIDDPPYILDIRAINTDTKKAHEYNLYVNIMPKKPIAVIHPTVVERITEFFGGVS